MLFFKDFLISSSVIFNIL